MASGTGQRHDLVHGRRKPVDETASLTPVLTKEHIMAWTTPAATDLRFGFEITMYIANR
jgi:coenzyme PQQ precursor peptide PqqA